MIDRTNRKSRSRSNLHTHCKVKNCNRPPNLSQGGVFILGLCGFHYNQFHSGIRDKHGKLLNRETVKNFNKSIIKTVSLYKKAHGIKEGIDQDKKISGSLFGQPSNKEVEKHILEITEKSGYLSSEKFIVSNLENLSNETLRAIYKTEKIKKKRTIDTANKAIISKALLRGVPVKKVIDMYPELPKAHIIKLDKYLKMKSSLIYL